MKILITIFCVAMLLSGCMQGIEPEGVVAPPPEFPIDNIDTTPTPDTEEETSVFDSYIGKPSPIFVSQKGKFDILNDDKEWFYYYVSRQGEMRKCKLDLSEDICVFSSVFLTSDFYLNPDACFTGWDSPKGNMFVFNVIDNARERVDWVSIQNMRSVILYQEHFLFFSSGPEASLEMHDLAGNHIKKIYSGQIDSYAVIDDAVYFYSSLSGDIWDFGKAETYDNSVIKYDIATETTETLFEFEVKEAYGLEESTGVLKLFSPRVAYNMRDIIVQNSATSFVYTSIDNINPKEIELGPAENYYDWAFFIHSNDDNLYFALYKADERDNDGEQFGHYTYFMISQGTTELIELKQFDCHYHMFFSDGYLYYLNEDGEPVREKMHD